MSTSSFGIIKLALRRYTDGENIFALMELKSLLKVERDCWTAYLVRGKVNAALHRYYEAIADYSLVLEMSENLNQRNRRLIIQAMALCSSRLSALQKVDLERYFRRGPELPAKDTAARKLPPITAPALDKRVEPGRIAHIGKFLIDSRGAQNIEHFIANGFSFQSRVRILSFDVVEKLKNILKKVDRQPGVLGSCIIGVDGLLRVTSLPQEYDSEALGTCALAIYLTAGNTCRKIGGAAVNEIIVRSTQGYMVIAEFDDLIFITLASEQEPDRLSRLVRKIARAINT